MANRRAVTTLSGGHKGPIWSVAFSEDGQRILTGGGDHVAKLWFAANGRTVDQSGRELPVFKHTDEITSVAFSPGGARILTGSRDRTAILWDALTGEELFTLYGHSAPVSSVGFSPDGLRIITGSYDRTAKVWDALNGGELLTLAGHEGPIWSVAFSRDGHRIITGSEDKTCRVWEAARPGQVKAWQDEELADAFDGRGGQRMEINAGIEHRREGFAGGMGLQDGAAEADRETEIRLTGKDARNHGVGQLRMVAHGSAENFARGGIA